MCHPELNQDLEHLLNAVVLDLEANGGEIGVFADDALETTEQTQERVKQLRICVLKSAALHSGREAVNLALLPGYYQQR